MKRCFIRGFGCSLGFRQSPILSALLWASMWLSFESTSAAVLAQWDFNATTDTNHPATSAGEGMATVLGGLSAQFASGSGSSDPAGTNDMALALSRFPAQGMAARSAGVQFAVSTSGYDSISLKFDLRASATASRKGVVLVSGDGITFSAAESFYIAVDGGFTNAITVPLATFAGASNNPRFTLRIVSDFSSGTNYVAVKSGSNYGTTGTWRLDRVTVTGEPVVPVHEAPRITRQPESQSVAVGATVQFQVTATGTAPLQYQWLYQDAELDGQTAPTLVLPKVTPDQAGLYRVKISNSAGFVLSEPAVLAISVPAVPILARVEVTPAGRVRVRWNATPGVPYRVERSSTASGPFTEVIPSAEIDSFEEAFGPKESTVFYRVKTP